MFSADGFVANGVELTGKPRGPDRQLAERLVLHFVLAAHLLDHQLGVGEDLEFPDAKLDRLLEPCDQRAVLGDVVRRDADRLAMRSERAPVLRLQYIRVGRRAGIATRAAVGPKFCSQGAGCSTLSICARWSRPE